MDDHFGHDDVLTRSPAALSRQLLGGVLVLMPDMAAPFRIATPGNVIWHLLEDPRSVASLVNQLCELYDESPGVVTPDIQPVLRTLQECGAVLVTRAAR